VREVKLQIAAASRCTSDPVDCIGGKVSLIHRRRRSPSKGEQRRSVRPRMRCARSRRSRLGWRCRVASSGRSPWPRFRSPFRKGHPARLSRHSNPGAGSGPSILRAGADRPWPCGIPAHSKATRQAEWPHGCPRTFRVKRRFRSGRIGADRNLCPSSSAAVRQCRHSDGQGVCPRRGGDSHPPGWASPADIKATCQLPESIRCGGPVCVTLPLGIPCRLVPPPLRINSPAAFSARRVPDPGRPWLVMPGLPASVRSLAWRFSANCACARPGDPLHVVIAVSRQDSGPPRRLWCQVKLAPRSCPARWCPPTAPVFAPRDGLPTPRPATGCGASSCLPGQRDRARVQRRPPQSPGLSGLCGVLNVEGAMTRSRLLNSRRCA